MYDVCPWANERMKSSVCLCVERKSDWMLCATKQFTRKIKETNHWKSSPYSCAYMPQRMKVWARDCKYIFISEDLHSINWKTISFLKASFDV